MIFDFGCWIEDLEIRNVENAFGVEGANFDPRGLPGVGC